MLQGVTVTKGSGIVVWDRVMVGGEGGGRTNKMGHAWATANAQMGWIYCVIWIWCLQVYPLDVSLFDIMMESYIISERNKYKI